MDGRQSWNVRLQESQENCFERYAGVHWSVPTAASQSHQCTSNRSDDIDGVDHILALASETVIQTLLPIPLMTSWSAVSNAAAVIRPAERIKRWGLLSSSGHSSQMASTLTLVLFKRVRCFYLMRKHVTYTLSHTFLFHSCVSRARTLHACARWPYANLPQWAFLHRWRALPETFVHFLMFIDT